MDFIVFLSENTVLPLQNGIDATPCIKSSRSVERTNAERERNIGTFIITSMSHVVSYILY